MRRFAFMVSPLFFAMRSRAVTLFVLKRPRSPTSATVLSFCWGENLAC